MSINVTSDGEVLVYFRLTHRLSETPIPAGDNLTADYNEFNGKTYYRWYYPEEYIMIGDFETYIPVWGWVGDPTEIGADEPFDNPYSFSTDLDVNGYDYYNTSILSYSLYEPSADDWWEEIAAPFQRYDALYQETDTFSYYLPRAWQAQYIPVGWLHAIPAQYHNISLAATQDLAEALAEQRQGLKDLFGDDPIDASDITPDIIGDDLTRAIVMKAADVGGDFMSRTADAITVVGDFTADAARKVHDIFAPILRDTIVERAADAVGDAASDAARDLMKAMAEAIGTDAAVRENLITAMDNHRQVYIQKEGALRKVILLDDGETREVTAWSVQEANDIKARFLDAGLNEEQKIIRDALKSLETEVRDEVKTTAIGIRGALADKFGGMTGGEIDGVADGFVSIMRPGLAFGGVTLGTLEYGFAAPGFPGAVLELTGDTAYALGDNAANHVTSDGGRTRVALDEGDDRFEGGKGQDEVSGDGGADTLLGGGGGDWLFGGGGNDLVKGGSGFDALLGAGGKDKLIGGAGGDLVIGGGGNDVLRGGSGADELRGDVGRDKLIGQGGNDLLVGGKGKDVLKGGGGADMFLFETAKEAGRGKGADKIAGFSSGADKIDLSALDLVFVGAADFSGSAGELRWDAGKSRLFGDLDGDGGADLALIVRGDFAGNADDLIL